MKADRLLSEILLLQAHGRLSVRELAERLEISTRTAQRDMESLCMAGVPLVALRGAHGGWQIDCGWRTEVPGLDEPELRAMLMAQPSALGDPHLAAAADRAYSKLMAAMPTAMQAQAVSIRARLHIDPTGWQPFTDDLSMLPIVQDAIARDRKLTFTYQAPRDEGATRTVDPFGVVSKQATWYLVARTDRGMRTYRISQMSQAVVLPAGFERPAGFDLAKHWSEATAQFSQQRRPVAATVAFSPEALLQVQNWCRMLPAPAPWKKPLPQGWTVHELSFESVGQARFVLLGLGSRVRVLRPSDLKAEVEGEIRRAYRTR